VNNRVEMVGIEIYSHQVTRRKKTYCYALVIQNNQ